METTEVQNLVKGWYERARGERDSVSMFGFLWFSFNAWLARESGEDQDSQMIEWLKHADEHSSQLRRAFSLALASETFRRNLKSLVSLSPIERSGRRVGEFVTVDSPEDLSAIIDGIYVVRCNLFHGRKGAKDIRDQKLVKVCGLILRKWVGNLVGAWRSAA